MIVQTKQFLFLLIFSILLSACSKPVKTTADFAVLPLEESLKMTKQHIVDAIKADKGLKRYIIKTNLLVTPFLDLTSLQEVEATQKILTILSQPSSEKRIIISALSLKTIKSTGYVVQGYISEEKHPSSKKKLYRIQTVTTNMKTGQVLTRSNSWIKGKLAYEPTAEYKSRPFFANMNTKNNKKRINVLSIVKNTQTLVDKLKIKALLNEAGKAYNNKNYSKSLKLYQQAETQKTEEQLRIYAGLYLTQLRLKYLDKSEEAFRQLIKINLKETPQLNAKILFAVNSTDFSGSPFLKKQFSLWVKNIALYFAESKQCFSIIGHSSHTGSPAYNIKLSGKRANAIRDKALTYYDNGANKIRAIGKGFNENIVGTGSDDASDAIDRRVEFIKMNCR